MPDRLWSFAEACDETQSQRAVRNLLAASLRDLGFEYFMLTTHGGKELRSLGVLVHNWPVDAVRHLFDGAGEDINPLFDAVDRNRGDVVWQASEWRSNLEPHELNWVKQLRGHIRGNGVSRSVPSALVTASCSVISANSLRKDRTDLAMRMANYAYHHIQYLQKPTLSEPERLTAREQECLYRAAVCGERPSTVARKLGVKVSTIRTLRQKANARLDADSPEQAVWHMLETGQLFRRGRKTRPRTW